MADVKKQCSSCQYWRAPHSDGGGLVNQFRFCHHLLWTRKRRVEEDGWCLSYKKKTKRERRYGHARRWNDADDIVGEGEQ